MKNKKKKKKIGAGTDLGYCPIVLWKKKILYCNLRFVLQEEGWLHERVSQYKNCIVTGAAGGLGKMYCKRGDCIVTE